MGELRTGVKWYLTWYDHGRRYSSDGNVSPTTFELETQRSAQAAKPTSPLLLGNLSAAPMREIDFPRRPVRSLVSTELQTTTFENFEVPYNLERH